MYIAPGQGQISQWGQNFDDNTRAFSLYPYVASFKMISSKSDFIHIFNDFIHEPRHEKTCLRKFPTKSDSNWLAQLQKLA